MVGKEPQNCWEFWNCPQETKENCLVYIRNLGKSCWTAPYSCSGSIKKDFQKCLECQWYKKLNKKENEVSQKE